MKNKKPNLNKYENINSNENADFEKSYKDAIRLLGHLQNRLQQLAASHKAIAEKESGGH